MKEATFMEKIESRWSRVGVLSVGLDPDFTKIPEVLKKENTSLEEVLFTFNREIIDATADLVCAYKPNSAFFEAHGEAGMRALYRTVRHIQETYADIPIILDAKRGDIGNTNEGYVKAIFDELGADAVTIHPYLGKIAMQPFLARKDKGIFILAKTSNEGSGEFQDLTLGTSGDPLYKVVAQNVASSWNQNGNCGLVVGATYPEELAAVRAVVGDMPILIPGIGAQGGDVEKTVLAGKNSKKNGMIITSSRSVLFASSGADFAEAARKVAESLAVSINSFR
ncbi:MAG: orotidine-5'-phosphate decarboxylase [Patescibacteria group bacterium]